MTSSSLAPFLNGFISFGIARPGSWRGQSEGVPSTWETATQGA